MTLKCTCLRCRRNVSDNTQNYISTNIKRTKVVKRKNDLQESGNNDRKIERNEENVREKGEMNGKTEH